MTEENKRKINGWLVAIAIGCVAVYFGLQNIDELAVIFSWIMNIIMPLLVGVGIALILNVPMRFLEERLFRNSKKEFLIKSRRAVAFLLSLIFVIGMLAGIVTLILPTLVETVTVLVQSAVKLVEQFNSMSSEEIAALPFGEILLDINWQQLLDSLKSWLSNQAHAIVDTVFGTVTSFIGSIIDLFVSVAFAIYVIFSKDVLKRQLKRVIRAWLPESKGGFIIHALSVLNVNFRNFVAGQSIEAVILALMCLVGMLIFRFPYAMMISTLVGVTALIPVLGSFIGGGVGAFMILTVDPIKAIWFVVYIIVLQQIEGNVIYPRVMGDRVNLSPLLILAVVTMGGSVGGPVGMFLAVPLASTVYLLFKEATVRREEAQSQGADTPDKSAAISAECNLTPEPEAAGDPVADTSPTESVVCETEHAAEEKPKSAPKPKAGKKKAERSKSKKNGATV